MNDDSANFPFMPEMTGKMVKLLFILCYFFHQSLKDMNSQQKTVDGYLSGIDGKEKSKGRISCQGLYSTWLRQNTWSLLWSKERKELQFRGKRIIHLYFQLMYTWETSFSGSLFSPS